MKRSRKLVLIVPALIFSYLAIAALWAWAPFDAALAWVPLPPPVPQSAALSERQSAILLPVEDPSFFAHHGVSEQLARYTVSVYMGTHAGRQVRGLAQAAQAYLGKPLAAITEQEFTTLAAMIKAPNQFHPVRDPAALAERSRRSHALLSGACQPDGWFDTAFDSCATRTATAG